MADTDKQTKRSKWRLLRRPTALYRVGAGLFLLGCMGVVGLALVYCWPKSNVVVYYFTSRPAGLWFSGLVPFLFLGAMAVRGRWALFGCAMWATGLVATEDVVQFVRLGSGAAREEFRAARMAFWSYMKHAGGDLDAARLPLRIVTWNVPSGGPDAARQLASLDPDIVLMQEFDGKMAKAIKAVRRFDGYVLNGDRQGILSRYPITRLKDHPLPEGLGTVYRVDVTADFQITCICLHLTAQEQRTRLFRWSLDQARESIARTQLEFEELRQTIGLYAAQGTVVFGGDFNVPPRYPDLRKASHGFVDCFSENGFGWGKTAPARLPGMRIDMIFVPEGAKVCYAAAVPTEFSDHYMTLAEVLVPVQRAAREPEPEPFPGGGGIQVRAQSDGTVTDRRQRPIGADVDM